MCELFAMSSRLPTTIGLSMRRLAARGQPHGHLADGWGIALYDDNDVRLLREPEPASDSDWIRFIDGRRMHGRLALAHLRHATQGEISLRNTQPFVRELGGRMHVFAHNGMLPGVEALLGEMNGRFRPVGTSDSEAAFCALLNVVAPLWQGPPPEIEQRIAAVAGFAERLRRLGPANFLYADGEVLIAHGHRRTQADGRIAPPGLTMLQRACPVDRDALNEAGVAIHPASGPQVLTLFASVPLTDEAWRPLAEGEIVAVRDGEVMAISHGGTASGTTPLPTGGSGRA